MSKKYPYYEEGLLVENLLLDAKNPRLPQYMKGKSEQEIIDYMILEESTLELMQAIGEKGFFLGEQLLVVENDDGKTYTVVEGNRRLTSVKLLNNPNLATAQSTIVKKIEKDAQIQNIDKLPCMVFEKAKDIHDYLGLSARHRNSTLESSSKSGIFDLFKNRKFFNINNSTSE